MSRAQSAFHGHLVPPRCNNCNSHVTRAVIWLAEIMWPNMWSVEELRKKSESAQCSKSMRMLVFFFLDFYPFSYFCIICVFR